MDMNKSLHELCLVVVISFFIGLNIGLGTKSMFPDQQLLYRAKAEARKELLIDAVKAGFAEWKIIDNAGNTEIRFKLPEAEKLLGEEKP